MYTEATDVSSAFSIDDDDEIANVTDQSTTSSSVNMNVVHLVRGKSRSSLWVLLFLLTVFAVLVVSVTIRCATDGSSGGCNNIHDIPSVGTMVNATSTGPLAVTALNTLVAIHFLLTINTFMLIVDGSVGAAVAMGVNSIALYVMLYVALISPKWYMALTPILLLGSWCSLATYGLYKYYRRHPTRKPFYISLVFLVLYLVPAILYVAFSAVPYAEVPHKDIAVLVCELSMLISCCGFVLVLAYHTRRVSYATEVRKGYHIE